MPNATDCDVYTKLRTADGEELNAISTDENATDSLLYNTPGVATYLITVRSDNNYCAGNTYQLKVTGPVSSGARPGPSQLTTNGHFGFDDAFGPLAGDTLYGASVDADAERDWFFFYTRAATRATAPATATRSGSPRRRC